MGLRVGIIGGGISGITTAHVLQRSGFEAVVFEKAAAVGGVWEVAYPDVRLQNCDFQYHLSDLPWPAPADLHPTGEQIRAYWRGAVEALHLDVRCAHEVLRAEERDGGWVVAVRHGGAEAEHRFDWLVVATGQYTEGKSRPTFPGEATFRGRIVTERDVRGDSGPRAVVVGFGKSALDVATTAAFRGSAVHHVFRTPRWALPMRLLGLHASWFLFSRFGSVMMPGWAHPTAAERFLHRRLSWGVAAFWRLLQAVIARQIRADAGPADAAGLERLRTVLPDHPLLPDLRSAAALAPPTYYRQVASGAIVPHRAQIARFEPDGVVLDDGARVPCDVVVVATGSETPRFPFLPASHRALLEAEPDGVQLYRHLIHPRLPRVAFAGFNHGFLHVPSSEVGAVWLGLLMRGELELPDAAEMERAIEHVRAWKRARITFEPSRSCAVSTRVQQYLDILLQDLGVSPYRKLPNVVAEVFGRYGSADYAGVPEEAARSARPRRPVPLPT